MKNITLKQFAAFTLLLTLASFQDIRAEFTTDLPYVELTTEQKPGDGSVWYFWFEGATDEDNNSIWVDWNYNGKYDEGEACPPSASQMGDVVSQTIRVYGNITLFSCNEDYITKIDLSNNNLIEKLYFTNNKVASIDVSNLSNLVEFCCNGNLLTEIDVAKNTKLEVFNCSDNLLTGIDISKNTNLVEFECTGNPISNLDISNNPKLEVLYCDKTGVNSLDLSKSQGLKLLNISDNKISTIDLSKCPNFNGIDCRNTLITSLDFSNNPLLSQVICDETEISDLDFSNNPELALVSCVQCNLSEIDLSKHANLEKVILNHNNLTKLDFSAATDKLIEIYCYMNNISESDMGDMINSLPDLNKAPYEGWLFVIDTKNTKEFNICNKNQVKTAQEKRWMVYDYRNGENYGMNKYEGSEPSSFLYAPNANRISVWANNGTVNVVIPEKLIGSPVNIYDSTGALVQNGILTDSNMRFNQLQKGVYIVTVGKRAWKIIL